MTSRSAMTVSEAVLVLGIPGRASLNQINSRFHDLVKIWHPDVSQNDPVQSHETFIRIREAYTILIEYCMNYEFSFLPEDVRPGTEYDPQEFWMSRFGDDPIWG